MKIKRIVSNHSYKEYDINGNIINENDYPGDKTKYFYDTENRLIKKIIISSYDSNEYTFEHNYEYNDFGYRISVFKTKETYTSLEGWSDDLKTKTETVETHEPITITDVKTENDKVISETITDFKAKTVKTLNISAPIEIKTSLKYDEDNRIIERITEEFEDYGMTTITEYYYSNIELKDSLGFSSTCKKIFSLTFVGYKGEEDLSNNTDFLLESLGIEVFDDEDNIINTIRQFDLHQQTSNPIKRKIKSSDKYYADGKAVFIDKTFDNIEKNVSLYEYKWLTKYKRMLVSITNLSLINDDIGVIDKIEYAYFND